MENKKDNRGGAELGAGRPKGTFKGNNERKRNAIILILKLQKKN